MIHISFLQTLLFILQMCIIFCTFGHCLAEQLFSQKLKLLLSNSPVATFAPCSPYSSGIRLFWKIRLRLMNLPLCILLCKQAPTSSREAASIDKIYYFSKKGSLCLRMCIFCCTFVRWKYKLFAVIAHNGYFKYNIIKLTDGLYITMVGVKRRYTR